MKWASEPSAYRNCILRASVWTGRNFSPARNVRSITAPSAARRSFVRTNAPPLPGLTCWNSRILKTVPSTSMWLPFLNWLVEITAAKGRHRCPRSRGCRRPRAAPGSVLDGGLDTGARQGAEANRAVGLEAGEALPVGHLLRRPGARLAGQGEVELQHRAHLAGLARGGRPEGVHDRVHPAGPQGSGDADGEVAVLLVAEVVDE